MGLSTPSTGGGAPTDAEYVTGSSNSELSNETVISPAGDILTSGSFGSTVSLSPGFGNFTQVDANNPSLVTIDGVAHTDGSTTGFISVDVDESGGTTADYTYLVAQASRAFPGSAGVDGIVTLPLPAAAQYKIRNARDPDNSNKIRAVRATIITP